MIHEVRVYDGNGKLIRTHTDKELTEKCWKNVTTDLAGLRNKARRLAHQKKQIQAAFYKSGPGQTFNQEAGNHDEN